MLAPKGKLTQSLALFGLLGVVVNFPEGYSNSYPNTSYKSFETLINDSYIRRGLQNGLSPDAFTWIWSAILNIWFFGYLIGTFVTPYLSEKFGRKYTLLVSNVISLVGAALSLVSVSISVPELYFVSRIIQSISMGISFGALILFLQETAKTEYRGMTSFFSEIGFILTTVMGIGFGMDILFGKNLPVLTGISMIPATLSIVLMIPLKETPKHLLIKNGDRKAALESLEFYQGVTPENEAKLDEMLLEMDNAKLDEPLMQSMLTVLRENHLRTAFFTGCLCLQVVVGIWPIIYLSTDILSSYFPEDIAQMASLAFITADFLAGVVGMFIIEKFGRRTLVLVLGVANTLSLCLFVAFDCLTPHYPSLKWGSVVALILFGITYGIGLGPIAFFITSELVAQKYRSVVQSMVYAVNTIVNFTLSFATLPAYTAFQGWSFLPLFVLPSILSLIYLYFNMPETMGREVHEVVEELMAREKRNKVAGVITKYGSCTGFSKLCEGIS